jgi:hypothetical protein
MDNLVDLVADLKLRAQRVREALQQARVELEVLDLKVTELARQKLTQGV